MNLGHAIHVLIMRWTHQRGEQTYQQEQTPEMKENGQQNVTSTPAVDMALTTNHFCLGLAHAIRTPGHSSLLANSDYVKCNGKKKI